MDGDDDEAAQPSHVPAPPCESLYLSLIHTYNPPYLMVTIHLFNGERLGTTVWNLGPPPPSPAHTKGTSPANAPHSCSKSQS